MKALLSTLSFADLFSFATTAVAQGQTQGYGPWPGMMGWGCGMGWPWPMMFIFWIVVIAGIVYFVRSGFKYRGGALDESALEILKKRYARGEINKDEYEKMKKDIS